MKSDSFIKMIAGVVIFSLSVNVCNFVVYADELISLESEEPVVDNAVALSDISNIDNVLSTIKVGNEDVAKVEKESDVSREQDQDSNEGQNSTTDNKNIRSKTALMDNAGMTATNKTATSDKTEGGAADNTNQNEEDIEKTSADIKSSKYANIGISTADEYVNIRKSANADSEVVGKLYKGSAATIISEKGDWYNIESGSVKGYIKSDYLATGLSDEKLIKLYGKKSITVKTTTLNVRTEANETSDIITQISGEKSYTVIKDCGEWIKINLSNTSGYVASDYVNIKVSFNKAISIEEEMRIEEEKAALVAATKSSSKTSSSSSDSKKTSVSKSGTKKNSSTGSSSSSSSKGSSSSSTTVKGESMSASDKEVMYIACIIFNEAGGESYEGKLAVANVILNRCKSSSYPNSIYGVISQSGQFSPYRTGLFDSEMDKYKNGKYTTDSARKQCVKAAKAALNGDNNVGSRTSFNMKSSTNVNFSNALVIGCHTFW